MNEVWFLVANGYGRREILTSVASWKQAPIVKILAPPTILKYNIFLKYAYERTVIGHDEWKSKTK
jgi:hypothetical protein